MTREFYEELKERGIIYQTSEHFEEYILSEDVRIYLGIDPTASSLHIGNLVPLITLLRFCMNGAYIYLIIGGGTCCVGDPSGKESERNLMPLDQIAKNLNSIYIQINKIINNANISSKKVAILNNGDWLSKAHLIEFLRDIGKHFPMAYLLAKEGIKTRITTGISYTEFSYSLLQAYDFLYLFENYGVKCQIGGSDQWGNITAGIELIKRKLGQKAYGITTPLLVDIQGKKLGKSEKETIYLSEELTTPYKFYQYFMNIDDITAEKIAYLLLLNPLSEIKEVINEHKKYPEKRYLQKFIGYNLTSFIHGEEKAKQVKNVSKVLFSEKSTLKILSNEELDILKTAIPYLEISKEQLQKGIPILKILTEMTAFIKSKNECRTLLAQKAIYVNDKPVNMDFTFSYETFNNSNYILIKKGKKDYFLLLLKN